MNTIRIHPRTPTPSQAQIAELGKLPSAVVSDQLERHGLPRGITQLTRSELGILAGPALTVRTRPGDNLAIHKAIDIAEPGDVLVIDAGGSVDRAVMGEIVVLHAASQGVAGLIVDGALRDGAEIARGDLPVFARGFVHLGPFRDGPGELRGTISLGGAVITNGDAVVADTDGVAIVPRARIDEVIANGLALLAREETTIPQARAGELDTSWLDAIDVEWVDGARP